MITRCHVQQSQKRCKIETWLHWSINNRKLGGCIVWNAHNTVFGSKRSAICALAVYFVHSTRRTIQGLVSHQFVTACVRQWVTNIRSMCREVPSTVVRRRRKIWWGFLYGVYRPREWLWIDSNGKQELIRRWYSERELFHDDIVHAEASAYAHWTDFLISTVGLTKYLW